MKIDKKRLKSPAFLIAAAFLCLLWMGQPTFACSCMARPTVLDSFETSEIVVMTKLISVEKIREKLREYDIGHIRSVKMLVEKVYKGKVKEGDILTFAQGGGADCIWTFDEVQVGRTFLFYLGPPTKGHPMFGGEVEGDGGEAMYHAVTCGRSNGASGARDDLSYLNNIEKAAGRTRFSGTFDTWFNNGPSFANLKIKIVGKTKVYQTKTDKDGFFEIYDLPAGEYLIQPAIPFGWKVNDYMLGMSSSVTRSSLYGDVQADPKIGIPITIIAKRHASLDLVFDVDTAIRGRVTSPAGKPMKDVCVKAVSTELKRGDYRGHSDCTDEKGVFLIDEMEPGNYILVANDDGKMSGNTPFGIVFYPGVSNFKDAGVIRVDAGRYANGMDIEIPATVEVVEISGQFLYADDKPVVEEWVKFKPDDESTIDDLNARTDKFGRFSFKIPKGAAGKLTGEMYTYVGEFTKCKALDDLIRESGKTWASVFSNKVDILGDQSQNDVKLVFPFPSCLKAKE